jgi:hypothetical protein
MRVLKGRGENPVCGELSPAGAGNAAASHAQPPLAPATQRWRKIVNFRDFAKK